MKHGGIQEIIEHKKCPGINGSRDSFGIGRNFIHENEDGTKKEITNWKEWERAGYKDAASCTKNHIVKEKIKEKKKQAIREGRKPLL